VSELRQEIERLEVEQVRAAVAEGWSWREIAEALGVSKQAAHRKHAAKPAPPPPPASGTDQRQHLVVAGQARQTVEYAREEARSLKHPAVEPQHLLLGLLRQGEEVAGALTSAGVTLEAARAEVRALGAADEESETGLPRRDRVPVSAAARAAFEQSLREAVARGDGRLGPEHLLLALLRDRRGGAAEVLGRVGVPAGRLQRLAERAAG
jgi:hypothetical protein